MRLPSIGSVNAVRVLAVATLIIFASQLVVVAVLWRVQARDGIAFQLPLPSRAAAIVDLIDAAGDGDRANLVNALSSQELRVHILPALDQGEANGGVVMDAFRQAMRRYTDALDGRRVVAMVGPRGWRRLDAPVETSAGLRARFPMRLQIELSNGEWLNIETPSLLQARARQIPIGLFAGLFGLAVAALALRSIWNEVRPVRDLAQSARSFSETGQPAPVRPGGGRDMQDLVAAFNDLQQRVAKLLANRSLVMSAMSHDVRTYLTRLRLRIEALAPDSRDAAEATIDEIQALLDDTLAFAEAEGAEHTGDRVDLATLIESLAASGQFAEDVISISVHARPKVAGHAGRLERALVNVVGNAIKYGDHADISVTQTGSEAIVEIGDRGPGIAEADRDKVFEPFFRLDASRGRSQEGAGLGLAIARTIIERHGGSLHLTNRAEGGLIAWIRLPTSGRSGARSVGPVS